MRIGLAVAWLQRVDDAQNAHRTDAYCDCDVEDGSESMAARQNMAEALLSEGAYAQAEPILHALHEQLADACGAEHVRTLDARLKWAYTLAGQGRLVAAEHNIREVLSLLLANEWTHEQEYVNSTMANLAVCVRLQGRYLESESIERDVLALNRRVFGITHPCTLKTHINLAHSLYGQLRYSEAMALLNAALRTVRQVFGVSHPLTVVTARTQSSWRAVIHRSNHNRRVIRNNHRFIRRRRAFEAAIVSHGLTASTPQWNKTGRY